MKLICSSINPTKRLPERKQVTVNGPARVPKTNTANRTTLPTKSLSGFKAPIYSSFIISKQRIELAYSKINKRASTFTGRLAPKDAVDTTKLELDIAYLPYNFVNKPPAGEIKLKLNFTADFNLPPNKSVASANFVFVPSKCLKLALWEGLVEGLV